MNFKDIYLIPAPFSNVRSRADVNTSVTIGNGTLNVPLIASNMDTVYSPALAKALAKTGGRAVTHRFCTIQDNVTSFKQGIYTDHNSGDVILPWVSVGVSEAEFERVGALVEAGAKTFVIDVANAASIQTVEQYNRIRKLYNVTLIVGNFDNGNQIREFLERVDVKPDAVKVSIGSGCFVRGTKVLMSDGSYKPIEKIKIHDKVINRDGNVVEVIGTKYSGMKEVIKYKNNIFHNYSYSTSDHKHFVGSFTTFAEETVKGGPRNKILERSGGHFEWKSLENLTNDVLLMPRNIKFELPVNFEDFLKKYSVNVQTFEIKDYKDRFFSNYDLGYIFGTFLGDGHARVNKNWQKKRAVWSTVGSVSWYFGKNEQNIVDKLVTAVKNVFNIECSVFQDVSVIRVVAHCIPLARLMCKFGKKTDKHLPNEYRCLNKEYNTGLYDGLVDSDGHYNEDGRITLSNTSEQIIELFMFLNYELRGYFPSCVRVKGKGGGLLNKGKPVKDENCQESLRARTVKRPERTWTTDFQISDINHFEKINEKVPTYDIEVDCETHSFIANNAIVHNSACLTERTATGTGSPNVECLLSCKEAGIPIIFDGGFDSPASVCKAIALGATAVMMGRQFAATYESPGLLHTNIDGKYVENKYTGQYKPYRGSASLDSYKVQGKVASFRIPEGESTFVQVTGSVSDVVQTYQNGLRSAMSYANAHTVKEFHRNASWGKK